MEPDVANIVNVLFALAVVVIGILSLIGIYILLKHGLNRSFGIGLSFIYTLVFVSLVISSLAALNA